MANDVTLISAGYHDPTKGSLGSGIFQGGQVLNMTYDSKSGSRMITADIKQELPIEPNVIYEIEQIYDQGSQNQGSLYQQSQDQRSKVDHFYLYEDLTLYVKKPLNPEIYFETLMYKELKCNFTYVFNGNTSMYFVIYDGYRTFANGKFKAKIQVCGVIPQHLKCFEKNSTFSELQIEGTFNPESTVMPVVLDTNLSPITDFEYTKYEGKTSLKMLEKSVYSAALYARLY